MTTTDSVQSIIRAANDRGDTARHATSRFACALCVCVALVSSVPLAAVAQTKGAPLAGTRFNIDLVTGPIVGTNRAVGLGGAYTALGYGIDTAVMNPAAYAVRTLWDTRWFEFDVALEYSPGALRNIDFINSGKSSDTVSSDFLFVTLGGALVLGDVGVGGIVRNQGYKISTNAREGSTLGGAAKLALVLANYGACYAFLDGQLMIGLAARTASVTFSSLNNAVLGEFANTGPEVGAILAVDELPYRVGFAMRTAVSTTNDKVNESGLFTPPLAVVLPTEVQAGFAYQFGDRPLNRRFVNPHERERTLRNALLVRRLNRQRTQARNEQAERLHTQTTTVSGTGPAWLAEPSDPTFWREEGKRMANEDAEFKVTLERAEQQHIQAIRDLSRNYVLVSADVIFIGATSNGIGLDSFLSQTREDSGRNPALAFRIGAEGEPIPNLLRLRLGTYLEPSRIDGIEPRLHGTIGCDVKLFEFDVFGLVPKFNYRVSLSLDLAARYRSVGFSVGIWH